MRDKQLQDVIERQENQIKLGTVELQRNEVLLESLQRKLRVYKETIERQRAQIQELNRIVCILLHDGDSNVRHSPEDHLKLYYTMYEGG